MDMLMIVLRTVHIVLGVLWAGWAFSLTLFVEPASRHAGPGAGPFMQALTTSTPLVKVMIVVPLLVIASGLWMLWIVSGGLDAGWAASRHGMTLLIGSTVGILAFAYGMAMVRPVAMKMGQLSGEIMSGGKPPTAEQLSSLQTLKQHMRTRGRLIAIMLAISVTLMAAVRYVV